MSTRDAKEPIDPDDLGDLLATPDFAPPAGLAATILGTALTRRQPGSPSGEWASTPITPQEGYLRAVASFGSLLASLTDKDWQQPAPTAHASWTVPDVVSHVIAIERYQAALLSGHQSQFVEQEGDHHAFTLPSVAELRTLDRVSVLERWRSATAENMVSAGSADLDLGRRVSFHGVPMRTHSLLVVRTFEIWTHSEDISRAIGHPVHVPDASQLYLMSNFAIGALPLGMALAGTSRVGRTARVVLTGPGGGTWSQTLEYGGSVAPEPDVVLIADVVDFCRVAAQRITSEALNCTILGDRSLAEDLLIGVAMFAA